MSSNVNPVNPVGLLILGYAIGHLPDDTVGWRLVHIAFLLTAICMSVAWFIQHHSSRTP